MRPTAGEVCSGSGEGFGRAYPGEPRCGLCRGRELPFARAAAYGSYTGGLRELIHLLKYERVRPAVLHAHKLRQRGFNQAELIARAALMLKPAGEQVSFNAGVLERHPYTRWQIGLTLHQRQQKYAGRIRRPQTARGGGREILLVDDVFTMGTTVSQCARVLRREGAIHVCVATVARTLHREAAFAISEEEVMAQLAMAAHG